MITASYGQVKCGKMMFQIKDAPLIVVGPTVYVLHFLLKKNDIAVL